MSDTQDVFRIVPRPEGVESCYSLIVVDPEGRPHLPLTRFYAQTAQILARLTQPLQDIYHLGHTSPDALVPFLRYMYQQMAHLDKPFWAWSEEEWISAILPCNGYLVHLFSNKSVLTLAL